MKSYSGMASDGSQFHRLVIPVGREMPHAPAIGETFHLDVDMPEPTGPEPWYPRGTYTYNGSIWTRLNMGGAPRKVTAIGSQEVEIERKGQTQDVPQMNQGYEIASVSIRPTHRRATFSGVATLWVDSSVEANAWIAIFRETKLVGLAATFLAPGKTASLSLTFVDIPATAQPVTYTARVNMDKVGTLLINQSSTLSFDGAAQTTLIVAENN
jgi:hypothetical protein